jgi:hypothetical protein
MTVAAPAESDPVTVTLTEADRIAEIDPADWNRLAGGASLYSAHAWLAYVEEYGDCAPRYLVAHAGGRPVAALPTYRFTGPIPRYYDPEFLVPGASVGRPVLVGGTRQGYATEFLVDPGRAHRPAVPPRGRARHDPAATVR